MQAQMENIAFVSICLNICFTPYMISPQLFSYVCGGLGMNLNTRYICLGIQGSTLGHFNLP